MDDSVASPGERFVGRDRELRQLDAACASAAGGRGSVVVISGAAGIGKTRLCDEVAGRARGAGLRAVVARCWVDGGAPPLWPWQPVLTELCGSDAADLLASDAGLSGIDSDRFARFAAVTERLATACRESPACLIVDDAHAADAGTVLLMRFVARARPELPLLLVLTRRREGPRPGAATEMATATATALDEIEAEGVPLVLQQLDVGETAAFLDAHGLGDVPPDLLATVHKVTGGNPLFLRRIAALGPAGLSGPVPAGLRVAIERAVARLDDEAQRLVRLTSVLGPTASLTEAAALTGCDSPSLLVALDAAADAGLVTRDGADGFGFSHELVRTALEEAIPPADRLDAHARAAAVVGGGGAAPSSERLARRAHHALAAAPRSLADTRLAVSACQAAARSMMQHFAYEQADRLLSAAVALHETADTGPPSARLLVAWAQAALHCGRLSEARRRFDRAASAAERERDPVAMAEAALGLGGHWANEHREPVPRARVLGLQRAALAGLPDGHPALECRLRVRLAAEATFEGAPIEPVLDALAATRRCGDPLALAEALSLTHHVLFVPDHTDDRMPLADELVRVASEAGHGVLGLMGLCWRAADLFHLGDDRALRALEALRERAAALACQNVLHCVGVMDVMVLIADGRLGEAEEAAGRSFELGEACGETDALGYYGAQMLVIRWLQGRAAELVDAAEEVAASPRVMESEFSLHAGAAMLAACSGQHDRARAHFDRLTGRGLAGLRRSSAWLAGLSAIVETAAVLRDRDVSRQAYELMAPHAARPTIGSIGIVSLGSTERALGLAAHTFGDAELATAHLERAIAANHRLRNRPLLTLSRANLADVLSERRDVAGGRERAIGLLTRAIEDAERMGMAPRAAGWRTRLDELTGMDEPATSAPVSRRTAVRDVVIRKEGGSWTVGLDGDHVRVRDLVGMRYLSALLTCPGEEIPALALASEGPVADAVPQDVLDDEARDRYARRMRELSEEIAEAEAHNDTGRVEARRLEYDALLDELEAAAGLGRRARRFADPAERARTAVRKAITRAIDAIDAASPVIGTHLRRCIVTGTMCSYTPRA